nr:MAG TPA: hypothetical protein [Caudoviricetes sp.]
MSWRNLIRTASRRFSAASSFCSDLDIISLLNPSSEGFFLVIRKA